jgi:phosphatidylinositol kinase/protein kinase (PI-3  family)
MEKRLFERVPTMLEFVRSIIYLRDQFEVILDRKSKVHSMDVWSHYLVEFHISRFEKMSIPGQYIEVGFSECMYAIMLTIPQHRDSNIHFVDIKRISTRMERCRSPLPAVRRIALIGQDGSTHTFTVQYYMQYRPIRRDERFMQLTRVFNE